MIKSKQLEDTLRSESSPFDIVYADRTVGDLNGAIRFTALNNTGGAIAAYKVVYINGVSGNTPTIALADADNASAMPAFGLTAASSNNGDEVDIITFGNLKGVDTSLLSVGTTLYVSTVAGEYTATAPTGSSAKLQNIGKIVKSDQNGIIKVGGAGRSAATPNLDTGKFFIGNASNQSSQSVYALPTADGSANQVLATDGSGQLSFVDQSGGAGSVAADDISVGDAAVTITTTVGDITIDAQGNDTDIVFKGTDGGVDLEMLRLDASSAGTATFSNDIKMSSDGANLMMGANNEVYIQHQHNKGLRFYVSTTEAGDDEPNFSFWNGANVSRGPQLELINSQGTDYVDGEVCGSLDFLGNTAGSTLGTYSVFEAVMENTTNHCGGFNFQVLKGGTNTLASAFKITGETSGGSTVDVLDHDEASEGLKLAGTLITASAAEINFLDTSVKSPSNGDVLSYNGTNLAWTAPSGGSASTPGMTIASPAANYTISTSNGIEEIYVLTPTTDISVFLPAAATAGAGYKYTIKNLSSNTITVDPDGTEFIDFAAQTTFALPAQYDAVTLVSNGLSGASAGWYLV